MLHVDNLTIHAGDFTVRSASIRTGPGEYYFLLGESGSGKSLILEAVAGIRRVHGGRIRVNGIDITHKDIHKRNVGMVFQNLAIFPHMSVYRNIAFPLKRRGDAPWEIQSRVQDIAGKMSITHLLDRHPGSLSGGEHQRVALARTLVMEPPVLLLDEPLSSLDLLLKEEMVALLRHIHRLGQTILHVTHDYHVVAELAGRISIIDKGNIVQTGTPAEIARAPSGRLAERIAELK
ncbi:MAG: ATP-binding cassette domain-containing protein [Bacteroidales bacterium]